MAVTIDPVLHPPNLKRRAQKTQQEISVKAGAPEYGIYFFLTIEVRSLEKECLLLLGPMRPMPTVAQQKNLL